MNVTAEPRLTSGGKAVALTGRLFRIVHGQSEQNLCFAVRAEEIFAPRTSFMLKDARNSSD
jgi:hypothetical protein